MLLSKVADGVLQAKLDKLLLTAPGKEEAASHL
jgi:hypothetical protein